MAVYQDKKSKKWMFRVYVYDALKGKNVQKTRKGFLRKKDAQEAEAIFIAEYENKKYAYKSLKMDHAVKEFLEFTSKRVKITTLDGYKTKVEKYIKPYFNDVKVEKINRNMITEWYNKLEKIKAAPSYKNAILGLIIKLFDFINNNYDIRVRYVYDLPRFKAKKAAAKKDKRTYTPDEFEKFVQGANEIQTVLFNVLFFGGLRFGELRGLKWIDFNPDEKSLNIERQIYSKVPGKGNMELPPKTKNSIRTVFLPDKVSGLLFDWLQNRKAALGFKNDWFIFGDIKPLGETTIKRWKDNLARKNKLHQITIHEFRHSYTTFLYYSGVKPEIAKELLGHNSIATTLDIYTHLDKETIAAEVRKKLNK